MPRDDATQSGLDPPMSISNLENTSQSCPQANPRFFSLLGHAKLTTSINCHTVSTILWTIGTSLIYSMTLTSCMPIQPALHGWCQILLSARDACSSAWTPVAAVYEWVPMRLSLDNINLAVSMWARHLRGSISPVTIPLKETFPNGLAFYTTELPVGDQVSPYSHDPNKPSKDV